MPHSCVVNLTIFSVHLNCGSMSCERLCSHKNSNVSFRKCNLIVVSVFVIVILNISKKISWVR
jgi:hypothetical protein